MTDAPLAQRFDVYLFDLDGVLYAGTSPIPGAPEQLARLRTEGSTIGFVTNNAAWTPDEVAAKLTTMNIPAEPGQVVTSAMAAAGMLASMFPPDRRILVVGGAALSDAVSARGLVPVTEAADDPDAVVQGFHPDLGWRALAEGAYAVARGASWVATNTDRTLPTDQGFAPGNGALVQTIAMATGRRPRVAGKPERPVFDETLDRLGAAGRSPLVIGDRLDTDILGANNAGLPSLLVLTGVCGVRDLLDAPVEQRPTYVASDLSGLFRPYHEPSVQHSAAQCGGWRAALDDQRITLSGRGPADEAVRALAAVAWRHADPKTLAFDFPADAGQ